MTEDHILRLKKRGFKERLKEVYETARLMAEFAQDKISEVYENDGRTTKERIHDLFNITGKPGVTEKNRVSKGNSKDSERRE